MNARVRELSTQVPSERLGAVSLVVALVGSEESNSFILHFDNFALLAHFLHELGRRTLPLKPRARRPIARILSIDGIPITQKETTL